MMWNWLVSGLACGATLLLYDGSPFADNGRCCSTYAAEKMTHFGTSAKFIDAAAKMGLIPGKTARPGGLARPVLDRQPAVAGRLRLGLSRDQGDILLASISGGTDIISCFVLGSPVLPVYRGEIQCRGLGMAVDVFDDGASRCVRKGRAGVPSPSRSCRSVSGTTRMAPRYRAAYLSVLPTPGAMATFRSSPRTTA